MSSDTVDISEVKEIKGNVFHPSLRQIRKEGVMVDFWQVMTTPDGEVHRTTTKRQRRFRLTNAVLADLEEKYGSIEDWSTLVDDRPYSTVLFTIGVMYPNDTRAEIAESMIDGNIEEYALALLTAYLISMGAEAGPALGELMRRSEVIAENKPLLINELIKAYGPMVESGGTTSSAPGSAPAEPTTTSGDAPSGKSGTSLTPTKKSKKRATKPSSTPKVVERPTTQQEPSVDPEQTEAQEVPYPAEQPVVSDTSE